MPMKNTGGGTREEAQAKIQAAREREEARALSIAGLAARLGLEDPREYIARTGRGHTTAILLAALRALEDGKEVQIVAHDRRFGTRLSNQLAAMAHTLRIKHAPMRIWPPTSFEDLDREDLRRLRSRAGVQLFRDHYRP